MSYDTLTRAYVHADGTSYFHAGGEHQVKFGMQYDRVGENIASGELRPRVTLRLAGCPGAGSGRVSTAASTATTRCAARRATRTPGFLTQGDIHTNNVGLFIQDSWTVSNKLTINGGLRTEREEVPTYTTGLDANGATIPEFAIKFGFADKLAPRVGAAYDLKGDGKWKVFASWGIFYDIFKLELPQGSFGGQKWIEYYYTLDTGRLDVARSVRLPAGLPGHVLQVDELPSPVARSRLARAEPEADEERGVHDGHRPRAERDDGRVGALRAQAARSRG